MNEPTMYIDEATLEDCEYVVAKLTDADRCEFNKRGITATMLIQNHLCYTVKNHKTYVIVNLEGNIIAMGGTSKCGSIWMVTTTVVEDLNRAQRRELLSMLKTHLQVCLLQGKPLRNEVWTGNTKHVALLRYLGAIFEGSEGEFIKFHFEPITLGG